MASHVYLIGAGPGDPELITVKAVNALAIANVVLVDDLVNPLLLQHCPTARIVNVGKRGGCQSTPQDFINRLMISLAQQGEVVARLKGGDPFLFGRGGEEMLALRQANIAYTVIPGVTAGLGATASVHLPITHRDYTHGVTFITGHTQHHTPIHWKSLVDSQTTLVIYMGLTHLPEIVSALLAAGMQSHMPAMIIEKGTLPDERAVSTTLEALPMVAHQSRLQSPSLVVIGEVVKLAQSGALLSSQSSQHGIGDWQPDIAFG